MRLDYHPQARTELIEAARFYEQRVTGLGVRFLIAVDSTVDALKHDPSRPAPDDKGRRKWRIKRFPYHFIYKVTGDNVFVLAVAHASRKPGYWSPREG
jgi:toxin ParE1/3/4